MSFWPYCVWPNNDGLRPVGASRHRVAICILAAAWGMVVDGNVIPVLAPTGNSTIFQSSTAAAFAVLGALFGPVVGALGGLVRDGMSFLVTLILHPATALEPHWAARKAADVFEDVLLGLGPGLARLWTRRLPILAIVAAASAWVSLPFLVIANTLVAGDWGGIGHALSTATGDWDQPVDPGLTVYALLTGCLVAGVLARHTAAPRRSVLLSVGFGVLAVSMMLGGAHP